MSAPWPGSVSGRPPLSSLVWKNKRPVACFLPPFEYFAGGQLDAAIDLRLARGRHQLIEKAAHLADVARRFRQAFFPGVELLEHDHRDDRRRARRSGRSPWGRASARSCRARRCGVVAVAGCGTRALGFGCVAFGHGVCCSLSSQKENGALRAPSRRRERPRHGRALSLCATRGAARHCASTRNVLRSTPMYLRPYMLFSLYTSNSSHTHLSSSASRSNGNAKLLLELLVRGDAVGRHADDQRARLPERRVQVAERLALLGAARSCCPSDRNRAPASCPRRRRVSSCGRPSRARRRRELLASSGEPSCSAIERCDSCGLLKASPARVSHRDSADRTDP